MEAIVAEVLKTGRLATIALLLSAFTSMSVVAPARVNAAPRAPSALTATVISATQVNLTWVDDAEDEVGFVIERAGAPGFTVGLSLFAVARSVRTYSDTSTTGGTTYYYRVMAFDAQGRSPASNTAVAATGQAGTLAPLSPAASVPASGTATVGPGTQTLTRLNPSDFSGPKLIVDQTGSAQGAAQLASLDGKVIINVPAGTRLRQANGNPLVTISHREVTSPEPPPLERVIIASCDLGPYGATFDPSINITMKHDVLPAGASESDLQVAYWDGAQWQYLASMADAVARTVSASIQHFSRFAIIGKVAPAPPASSGAIFSFEGLTVTPFSSRLDEPVTISVSVGNNGGGAGTCRVVLKLNGVAEDSQSIDLGAGDKQTVSFAVAKPAAGSYRVEVNGLGSSFLVAGLPAPGATPPAPPPPPAATSDNSSNWGVAWGALAGLLAGGTLSRVFSRRRPKTVYYLVKRN